jgi:hypothetical protein
MYLNAYRDGQCKNALYGDHPNSLGPAFSRIFDKLAS